ncbi:DNA-directed RNA polymerase subunit B'' [Nanobdella aerobiophila]|uniref:DNA-directed RNA polymerase n=1 Tax=Nanobdella aerobiophila TaxID=2586965 RepID=A0A915WRJ4_9ARCH|nr:DNA-directed RNA polymerase subunit B'' [Nanobdella aerobiophila]BBL45294.1 DNA-directed RNA polymerase subunit B'' [Nanobdella aerobiophila]
MNNVDKNKDKYILLYKYLDENQLLNIHLRSFEYFADVEMTEIGKKLGVFSPRILPSGLRDLQFKIDKIWLSKADFMEKEGVPRLIYPNEALIRNITYSGMVYMEFSVFENESYKTKYQVSIGRLPIMIRSKYCNTYGLSEEELIKLGEDPTDRGGYFIINGSEKVIILSEELSTNRFYVQEANSPVKYSGYLLSEAVTLQSSHRMELMKDGILYISFERYKRIPLIPLIKALGLSKDSEIAQLINEDDNFEETFINLLEYQDMNEIDDNIRFLADRLRLTGNFDVKKEKLLGILDSKLLPHVGTEPKDRLWKAYNLAKMARKILLLAHGKIKEDIKDHFSNKVVRTPGELLREMFLITLKTIMNDAMYQYERLIRRGRVPPYNSIFRSKIFSERFESAMGTGKWTRNRNGIAQSLDRTNKIAVLSHLTRVFSSISEEAELLEARMVHGTHWGRLDLIETPEGHETGLRKNLSLLSKISFEEVDRDNLIKSLESIGLRPIVKNISK